MLVKFILTKGKTADGKAEIMRNKSKYYYMQHK